MGTDEVPFEHSQRQRELPARFPGKVVLYALKALLAVRLPTERTTWGCCPLCRTTALGTRYCSHVTKCYNITGYMSTHETY